MPPTPPATTSAPTTPDPKSQLRTLIAAGLSFGEAIEVFAEDQDEDALIARAREFHARDGEVEFDQHVIVSRGDDNGAYVMGWIWVRDPEE